MPAQKQLSSRTLHTELRTPPPLMYDENPTPVLLVSQFLLFMNETSPPPSHFIRLVLGFCRLSSRHSRPLNPLTSPNRKTKSPPIGARVSRLRSLSMAAENSTSQSPDFIFLLEVTPLPPFHMIDKISPSHSLELQVLPRIQRYFFLFSPTLTPPFFKVKALDPFPARALFFVPASVRFRHLMHPLARECLSSAFPPLSMPSVKMVRIRVARSSVSFFFRLFMQGQYCL